MAQVNQNYLKLKDGYLFQEISRRVRLFQEANPQCNIIHMGIGDVTLPLTPKVIESFQKGVNEMGDITTFKGYGPNFGYEFLRNAIKENDYTKRFAHVEVDEIFITDGAKCDTGNILEIFGMNNKIAISDPIYPVYIDSTVMSGRTGVCNENGYYENIVYMPCTEENSFLPIIPNEIIDIVFLCFPNNPTGVTANQAYLQKWVDYAIENNVVILYDSAYEAYISESNIPHSIYEIKNARKVAIEFRSFSKTAGFTGTRCAYTVVPKELLVTDETGKKFALHTFWTRRQATKFNGVSYPVQRAAAAVYTIEGQKEIKEMIAYYMDNAKILKATMEKLGFKVYGGINAPYIWVKTKNNQKSWDFFDFLLKKQNIVCIPGFGFGPAGEGFVRFSSFAKRENVLQAVERLNQTNFI
jgi:LL-diaminopimelate aminotransferase